MRYFEQTYSDYDGSSSRDDPLPEHEPTVYLNDILDECPTKSSTCDGGIYTGSIGVAYMLYKLAKRQKESAARDYLLKAKHYVVSNLAYHENPSRRSHSTSFLCGTAGVLCVGALVHHALGETEQCNHLVVKYANLACNTTFIDYRNKHGSDELFNGRAGYLLGCFILNTELGRKVISDEITGDIFTYIVKSGRYYASKHDSPCPLMYAYYGREYLGAGHGLSLILLVLMLFKQHLSGDVDAEKDVRDSLDYLVSLQAANGNFPPVLGERISDSNELVHWCHGGPGIIYTLARAYLRYKQPSYLERCLLIGELTWKKGLLRKGPGICHGVAGSGYVFLTLYKLTRDKRHLHRANCFAQFLSDQEFLAKARTPDCPNSLFEGLAGTTCFLSDLQHPLDTCFPLIDIFAK